jgi:hypothetical protein
MYINVDALLSFIFFFYIISKIFEMSNFLKQRKKHLHFYKNFAIIIIENYRKDKI